MNVIVRNANKQDYEAVEAIMQQVQALHVNWRPDIYRPVQTVYSREYYEQLIEKNQLLVAETEGKTVGLLSYCYREIASDKQVSRKVLFVDDLAVLQDFRGKGIGRLLLEQMKKKVVSEKLDGLELQVNARNQAAREFYENLGFTEKSINLELLLG